jgi:hypothetical protein
MNEIRDGRAEDWWTHDQKAFIEDVSSIWLRKTFEKVPGIWIAINVGKLLRKLSKDDQLRMPRLRRRRPKRATIYRRQ